MADDPQQQQQDVVIHGYKLRNSKPAGQHSQVWEVVEPSSGRHFAMKILLPEYAQNGEFRAMLFHEAQVGLKLAHPNVVRIFKVFKDRYNPCFIMEFFPSGSLRDRIIQRNAEFLQEHCMNIFKQWATALAYMHGSGWLHRDVKPDNILVNGFGDAKIIDFALARKRNTGGGGLFSWFTRRGHVVAQGTRSYMSPEQIRDEKLDERADIYSFGCSLFELVTTTATNYGRPPFKGQSNQDLLHKHLSEKPTNPKVYNPDVNDDFAEYVLQMLAKKREDRPRNFHEVLMKLKSLRVFRLKAPTKGGGKPPA